MARGYGEFLWCGIKKFLVKFFLNIVQQSQSHYKPGQATSDPGG
jgi:hypothetical protein